MTPLSADDAGPHDEPPATVELCVGAIALSLGRLLLVQRGTPPGEGQWSVPGGRVQPGELLAEAVLRELWEETRLDAVCGSLLGWVERFPPGRHFVIMDFMVTVLSDDDPVAGDDARAARWVPIEDVAELDLVAGLAEFLHDHGILTAIT